MTYCENEQCEYNEDGCCEYEGALSIDSNGFCKRFRYKDDESEEITMNNLYEKWTISNNEEWFNEDYFFDTKEEAIEFGKTYEDFEGRSFFVGKIREVEMMCDQLAIPVLGQIQEQHIDQDSEFAETYLNNVKREHIEELDVLLEMTILDWAERYNYLPNYFRVNSIENIDMSEESEV